MKKLLIADDDKAMLGLVSTLLELEGYQSVTETNPADIVAAVQDEQPDLIILDVHLAGEETLNILKELKVDSLLGEIPVMMISGMDVRDKCMELGADEFILKPFHPQELLDKIVPLLENSKGAT